MAKSEDHVFCFFLKLWFLNLYNYSQPACLPAPRSHILNAEAKKSFIASSLISNLRSKDCKVRHIDECKETLLPHIISPSHIVAAEHHHTAS